jgi:hypothetical protein
MNSILNVLGAIGSTAFAIYYLGFTDNMGAAIDAWQFAGIFILFAKVESMKK